MGGRFRVLSRIGGGGTAEVYLGEQLSLARRVAVKVLRGDLDHWPGAAERFRLEAQILATVDHPSVVRVIDFEITPAGSYLVLEYVEGQTLEAALRGGPLSPTRALRLLTQLADGLAAVHERGVVHRDLKPQNVMLLGRAPHERARLLDFGIAKLRESELAASGLSMPGHAMGTPAYLAPEQARAEPVTAATDIYALGVMAFRMLSGTLPFRGPSPRDFLYQHVSAPPKELLEAAPTLLSHQGLCGLVMRCLEKQPGRRPASGAELLRELVALSGQQLEAEDPASEVQTTCTWFTPEGAYANTLRMGVPTVTAAEPSVSRTVPPRGVERQVRRMLLLSDRAHALWRTATSTRRRRGGVWLSAGLMAAALLATLLRPDAPQVRAERLLARGQPDRALESIDAALTGRTTPDPALTALKAAALHRLERHDDERAVLGGAEPVGVTPHPKLLEALAEDFARREDDPTLRAQLYALPQDTLRDAFSAFAREPPSRRQWGALRFLDLVSERYLDRIELYSRSLESTDCEHRATAVRRLSELGDKDAIPFLRALAERPKEDDDLIGVGSCGQDEATEAIRALNRRRPMGAR